MRVREYDALGRQVPTPFGASGWFSAVPGLAGQFSKVVPPAYIENIHPELMSGVPDLSRATDTRVRCPCGGRPSIWGREGRIVACDGDCGRYFLATGIDVRCAGPYEDEEAA